MDPRPHGTGRVDLRPDRLPVPRPSLRPRLRAAVVAASLLLAAAPRLAAAADCDLALAFAETVADKGQRAMASLDHFSAMNLASDARLPAIDAAQQAKLCGCPEAMPLLAEAARDATRANVTVNATAAQQLGASIRKSADAAIASLRACAKRQQ
jgi:hypothetical protein